jgi:hypothetical protein
MASEAWLMDERGMEPHVKLMDKSERPDGTFSRSDFTFDTERDLYVCPGRRELRKYRRAFSTPREGVAKDGAIRSRRSTPLRRLHAQTQVLSEYARTQDCALRSGSRS